MILERAFCTLDVISALKALGLRYVAMAPDDIPGQKRILEKCRDILFWNPEYLLSFEDGEDLYGISRKEKIWGSQDMLDTREIQDAQTAQIARYASDDEGFFNLYFQPEASQRLVPGLNKEISKVRDDAEEAASQGIQIQVPDRFRRFFQIEKNEDGTFSVHADYEEWRKKQREMGCFSILTSEDIGPEKAREIYGLRLSSPSACRRLTHQGEDASPRARETIMKSAYAVSFFAEILEHSIRSACRKQGLDIHDMIKEADRIVLRRLDNGTCLAVRDLSKEAKALFSEFEMDEESFQGIAQDYTKRRMGKSGSLVR